MAKWRIIKVHGRTPNGGLIQVTAVQGGWRFEIHSHLEPSWETVRYQSQQFRKRQDCQKAADALCVQRGW